VARALPLLGAVLRIDTVSRDSRTVLRLMGRITTDEVQELKARISDASAPVALDLEQVRLVDLDAARYLAAARRCGVELRRLPAYVRRWLELESSRLTDLE
jgi:hypothetical protein